MAETSITEIKLDGSKEEFSLDDNITITARFSIMGDLRESFTEKNWTDAYEKNDNTFKLKSVSYTHLTLPTKREV